MPITMPSSSRMKRQHRNVVMAGMRSISENDGAVYNIILLRKIKKLYKIKIMQVEELIKVTSIKLCSIFIK